MNQSTSRSINLYFKIYHN